ncbi:MAG: hypothetical protein ACR2M7_05290 [Bdellovibrionales bacterium]
MSFFHQIILYSVLISHIAFSSPSLADENSNQQEVTETETQDVAEIIPETEAETETQDVAEIIPETETETQDVAEITPETKTQDVAGITLEADLETQDVAETTLEIENQEILKEKSTEDQAAELPEEKFNRFMKEGHQIIMENLLKSSWFKSDSGMSDEFMADMFVRILGLESIIRSVQIRVKEKDFFNQLERYVFSKLNNGIKDNHIMNFIFEDQKNVLRFLLKNPHPDKQNPSYLKLEFNKNSGEDALGFLKELNNAIDQYQVKEIGINIHSGFDYSFAAVLSRFFENKNVDVRILGFCHEACSNYLLFSFDKISIGPYGIISYSSSASNFYKDFKQAHQEEQMRNYAYRDGYGGIDILLMSYLKDFKSREALSYIIKDEDQLSLLLKIENFLVKNYEEEITESLAAKILLSLSKEEKNNLYDMIRYFSYDRVVFSQLNPGTANPSYLKKQKISYSSNLAYFSQLEKEFLNKYKQIIKSELNYTLFDLIELSSYLIKNSQMKKFFPEYKRQYSTDSKANQPVSIIPSKSLLRKLGLNMQEGLNTMSKYKLPENISMYFLDINENQIEECGFFNNNQIEDEKEKCFIDLLTESLEKPQKESENQEITPNRAP